MKNYKRIYELKKAYIEEQRQILKKQGFTVINSYDYKDDLCDYFHFVDESVTGKLDFYYCQLAPWGGLKVSYVHKPTGSYGTGCALHSDLDSFDNLENFRAWEVPQDYLKLLNDARHKGDRYKDVEDFLKGSVLKREVLK